VKKGHLKIRQNSENFRQKIFTILGKEKDNSFFLHAVNIKLILLFFIHPFLWVPDEFLFFLLISLPFDLKILLRG